MLVHAVIGSVGHADETVFPLIEMLAEEGVYVTVIDNRGTFPTDLLDDTITTYFAAPGLNIHQVWNLGMDLAESQGAEWCCILNDDITLQRGAVELVMKMVGHQEDVWIAGFDYEGHEVVKVRRAVGSYREHGVGGFAYMIRPDVLGLRYDERFNWWGGDDDLIWTCLKMGGRAVVVEGANVSHPPGGNTTGRHYPELAEGIKEDYDLIRAKWGKSW